VSDLSSAPFTVIGWESLEVGHLASNLHARIKTSPAAPTTSTTRTPTPRSKHVRGCRELGHFQSTARSPVDRPTGQRAADRALDLVRWVAGSPVQSQAALAWGAAVLMVATDVMVFAGADPGQAADAVREGTGEFDVPDLPPTSQMPFRSDHWRPRR
jgi:hypothetical protein